MAARPLKGSLGKSPAPHPQLGNTPASNSDHHVDISAGMSKRGAPTAKAGAGMHDSYPSPNANPKRSGRPAKAGQSKQVKSKGSINKPQLS